MERSDTIESVAGDGTVSGWSLVAAQDGAPAMIDAVLEMDHESELTRSELCDVADVPYKTVYLEGTIQALVDVGLLRKDDAGGEEATFSVDRESTAFEAAVAFDEAVSRRRRAESA